MEARRWTRLFVIGGGEAVLLSHAVPFVLFNGSIFSNQLICSG